MCAAVRVERAAAGVFAAANRLVVDLALDLWLWVPGYCLAGTPLSLPLDSHVTTP
jgi:hypothetical protein